MQLVKQEIETQLQLKSQVTADLDAYNADRNVLIAELVWMTEELCRHRLEMADLQGMEELLGKARIELGNLERAIESSKGLYLHLTQEIEAIRVEKTQVDVEMNEVKLELGEKHSELSELRQQILEMTQHCESSAQAKLKLEEDILALVSRKAMLEKHNEDATSSLESILDAIDIACVNRERAASELSAADEACQSRKVEAELLQAEKQRIADDITALMLELRSANEMNENLICAKMQLEGDCNALQEELIKHQHERDSLAREVMSSSQDLENRKKEIEVAAMYIEDQELRLARIQESLQANEIALSKTVNEIIRAESQVAQLNEEIAFKQIELNRIEKDRHTQEDELQKIQIAAGDLKLVKEARLVELEQINENVDRVQRELEQKKAQVAASEEYNQQVIETLNENIKQIALSEQNKRLFYNSWTQRRQDGSLA